MPESPRQYQQMKNLKEGIPAAQATPHLYSAEKRHSIATFSAMQSSSSDDFIVSIRNVSKTYITGKQQVEALHNVSLDIYRGEFVAITGKSGSGKSTLLQLIGCLDRSTSGQIIVEGQDIGNLRDNTLSDLRRSTIGFVFQSFYLQPFLRLNDNIAVPAMFVGSRGQSIDDKVSRLLQQVGLLDKESYFPRELSGGEAQRAAIARALINSPSIILADEPTGNLDSANGQSIVDLFQAVSEESGATIVIVTHDAEVAEQADRVIELSDGEIV